ncbi:MAG TPA: BON domain-containing protein [Steroidobacteraceae bacterium]|jgi:osmotically-inducible protein OsmY|nr:BON domain-containing protein [Steroidobacteraceae bacterium]
MSNIQSLTKPIIALGGAAAMAVCLLGCASFEGKRGCASTGCAADERVAAEVQTSLDRHPELGPPGQIQVSALNSVVYLHGTVSNDLQRSVAKSVALASSGDAKIVNSIQVTEK